MGLISPGVSNLLEFLELWQELSTYDGDLRDPLWWPQERREELKGRATIPRVPQMSQSIPGKTVFPALPRFHAEDRLTPRWNVGQPCGKASWESLEEKPQITLSKRREARQCCYSSGGKHTFMSPLETRTDSPG